MTYEEFYIKVKEIVDVGYSDPDNGCVLIECNNCGEELYWFEGDVKRLYDTHYSKPCKVCNKMGHSVKLGKYDL